MKNVESKSNNIWLLVAVMVVVGLAAGVIGASITGNYLVVTDQSTFQNRYTYSAAESDRTFYNKTEIDKMISITTVEKMATYTTINGGGIGDYVKCPSGKRVISGGCSSTSAPEIFILHGFEAIKSNLNLDYNDAWQCSFKTNRAGTFSYHIVAYCQ